MAPADESTTEKEKKRYKGAVKQPQQKKGRNRVGKFFFFHGSIEIRRTQLHEHSN